MAHVIMTYLVMPYLRPRTVHGIPLNRCPCTCAHACLLQGMTQKNWDNIIGAPTPAGKWEAIDQPIGDTLDWGR